MFSGIYALLMYDGVADESLLLLLTTAILDLSVFVIALSYGGMHDNTKE